MSTSRYVRVRDIDRYRSNDNLYARLYSVHIILLTGNDYDGAPNMSRGTRVYPSGVILFLEVYYFELCVYCLASVSRKRFDTGKAGFEEGLWGYGIIYMLLLWCAMVVRW